MRAMSRAASVTAVSSRSQQAACIASWIATSTSSSPLRRESIRIALSFSVSGSQEPRQSESWENSILYRLFRIVTVSGGRTVFPSREVRDRRGFSRRDSAMFSHLSKGKWV
jgi:hypothetical protein